MPWEMGKNWIDRLPELQCLRSPTGLGLLNYLDPFAFTSDDVLFGCNSIYGVGKYFNNQTVREGVKTYREWFGSWIGYPNVIFLQGSGTPIFVPGDPYNPRWIKTKEEVDFWRAVLESGYNFIKRHCVNRDLAQTKDRLSKASKAILEFVLFRPGIRKIHFILDGSGTPFCYDKFDADFYENQTYEPYRYSHEQPYQYRKINGTLNKSQCYTQHELRHLHRLALRYPHQVAQKVICWYDGQQVQLPAKVRPDLWGVWTPRMNNIISRRPVYPPSHL